MILKKAFTVILITLLLFIVVINVENIKILEFKIKEYFSTKDINLNQNQQAVESNVAGGKKKDYNPVFDLEKNVINVSEMASKSVVSIIITKDLPVIDYKFYNPFEDFGPFGFEIPIPEQKGTEKREVGGGTGFIISEDGLIVTNKHVVVDEDAEYTAVFNDGSSYDVNVLARDPFQDIAILKIKNTDNKKFTPLKLGDSDSIKVGQFVVAVGNALGEFRNTVSFGVISGLSRQITASGGGFTEQLSDVIQTDAAINRGNSGGPLLNLNGEVIGINTAIAAGAQNIGFAIPINVVKKDIEQVIKEGKITYAFLGIYYTVIDDNLKELYGLPVNYGAWVGHNASGAPTKDAVVEGSPAEKAGIKRNDIILEFNGEKITKDNHLNKIIRKYSPKDKVSLKIMRNGKVININVSLGERTS